MFERKTMMIVMPGLALTVAAIGLFAAGARPVQASDPDTDEADDELAIELAGGSGDAGDDDQAAGVDVDIFSAGAEPLGVSSCGILAKTVQRNGAGALTTTLGCPANRPKMRGGGCNIDEAHREHAWLVDKYRIVGGDYRCRAYHDDGDNDFDLQIKVLCCPG